MKLRYWMITFLALFFGLCGIGFTQDAPNAPGKTAANRCSQFKMQVITPVEENRYKLTVVKPAKGTELKGEVINPCETASQKAVSAMPFIPNQQRIREKPESQPETQMKLRLPPLKLKLDRSP